MQHLIKILYICDCKKTCAFYESCQLECFHTADEMHAKNGIIRDILELETDRFEKIAAFNATLLYIERRVDD